MILSHLKTKAIAEATAMSRHHLVCELRLEELILSCRDIKTDDVVASKEFLELSYCNVTIVNLLMS